MGFIKHFDDDMPCTVNGNPNLYFPTSQNDLINSKEIKRINNWYVCFEQNKKTAKFKDLKLAVSWLNER